MDEVGGWLALAAVVLAAVGAGADRLLQLPPVRSSVTVASGRMQ